MRDSAAHGQADAAAQRAPVTRLDRCCNCIPLTRPHNYTPMPQLRRQPTPAHLTYCFYRALSSTNPVRARRRRHHSPSTRAAPARTNRTPGRRRTRTRRLLQNCCAQGVDLLRLTENQSAYLLGPGDPSRASPHRRDPRSRLDHLRRHVAAGHWEANPTIALRLRGRNLVRSSTAAATHCQVALATHCSKLDATASASRV